MPDTIECPGTLNGTCIHHEGEVIHRVEDRRRVTDLKEDINKNKTSLEEFAEKTNQKFISIARFKGWIIGILATLSVLGLTMFSGSFVYTDRHIMRSDLALSSIDSKLETNRKEAEEGVKREQGIRQADMKSIRDDIASLRTGLAIADTHYVSLNKELSSTNIKLDNTNENLKKIIEIIGNDVTIKNMNK